MGKLAKARSDWRELAKDPAYVESMKAACLGSFKIFCRAAFKHVYRKEFIWAKHHDLMVDALMKVWTGKTRNLIINIPPRYSKCVTGGTMVMCKDGQKRADEITAQDVVGSYSHGKLTWRCLRAVESYSKECVKVRTITGRSLTVSSDHPVLTQRGWVDAGKLTNEHYLIRHESIIDGDSINESELDFVTLMIFEGGCSSEKNIRFTSADKCIVDILYKSCAEIGATVKKYASNKPYDYNIMGGVNGAAANVLRRYGIIGCLAKNKRLPKQFFSMSYSQKLRFVSLMVATDGYITEHHGQICVTLASEGLIDDISLLLGTMGISAVKYIKDNDFAGAWELKITGYDAIQLSKKIDCLQKQEKLVRVASRERKPSPLFGYPHDISTGLTYKCRNASPKIDFKNSKGVISHKKFSRIKSEVDCSVSRFEMDDFIYDRVRDVGLIGDMPVFHLSVDSDDYDDQNFIANGFVVHNTEIICLFAAWSYAHNANCEFLHLSYSSKLATKNSNKVRNLIKSPFYRDCFGVEVNPDMDAAGEWGTKGGGIFKADAAGGQVTGFGAGATDEFNDDGDFVFSGCILIDDPLKPSDAHTVERGKVNENYDETIKSRRNSPATTPTICIMQRIHEGDFTAHLLADKAESFERLSLKALSDDGKALWPRKHTSNMLRKLKDSNIYVFSGQYQQEPTPAGGAIFKREWWATCFEFPEFREVTITADTAQKTKEHNDFSVFEAWGEAGGKVYLIDVIRGKWESPELKRVATAFIKRIKRDYPNLRVVNIEDKASGTGLIQSLSRESKVTIKAIPRNTDKVTRAYDAAPYIQSGLVVLLEGAPYFHTFVDECTSFSANDSHLHDDQVDAMMDAVEILLNKTRSGILML